MKQRIIDILNNHTTTFSIDNINVGDGVSDTRYDDVADEILRLFGVIQRSEQFCECNNPKGEGNQAKCGNWRKLNYKPITKGRVYLIISIMILMWFIAAMYLR